MRYLGDRFLLIIFLLCGATHTSFGEGTPSTLPSDRESLIAEFKTDEEAVKSIENEMKQSEKDAADAEALANNPPVSVSTDQRTSYIDQQKNAAQTAHDLTKTNRERLDEAKRSLDEASTRLKTLNETLPTTMHAVDHDSKR